jgi:glycosyltransferase involved in cell wall biosynthesis
VARSGSTAPAEPRALESAPTGDGSVRACLVIPIYNHKDTIAGVLDSLVPFGLPCLVVDDGSDADTRETLRQESARRPWVEVLRLPSNQGRGAALRHGYRRAAARAFSHVVQLDADGQHDARDVSKFLEAAGRAPDAVILGRPVFGAESPRARLYGRKISQAFVWAVTGSLAIRDPLCGFRCFPLARTLPLLDRVTLGDRMDFDPEIVVRLAWEGVPIVNVPTRVRYFPDGLSHFRMVRDNVRIARTYLRLVGARVRRGVR